VPIVALALGALLVIALFWIAGELHYTGCLRAAELTRPHRVWLRTSREGGFGPGVVGAFNGYTVHQAPNTLARSCSRLRSR